MRITPSANQKSPSLNSELPGVFKPRCQGALVTSRIVRLQTSLSGTWPKTCIGKLEAPFVFGGFEDAIYTLEN